MEECRVTDDAEYLLFLSGHGKGLRHSRADGEAAAHAHAGVRGVQRGRGPKRIAADVAGYDGILYSGGAVEKAPVRTARAKRRGARRGRGIDGAGLRLYAEYLLAQPFGVKLIHRADDGLADTVYTGGLYLLLHKAVKLFYDIKLLHLGGEVADKLHRKRICKAELEEGGVLRKDLLCVQIGNGGADNAGLSAVELHTVQRAGIAVLLKALHICLDLGTVAVCPRGGAHELLRVRRVGLYLVLSPLAKLHKAF